MLRGVKMQDQPSRISSSETTGLLGQVGGVIGAGIAAACCLGVPILLSSVTALGLGFLLDDALLMPIFAGFMTWSVYLLWKSPVRRRDARPFWLGAGGALLGSAGLWLLVTGIRPLPWSPYLGVSLVIAASLWNLIARLHQRRAGNAAYIGDEDVCKS